MQDRFKRRSLGQIICDDIKEYAVLVSWVQNHMKQNPSCRDLYSRSARDHGIRIESAAMMIAGYIESLSEKESK